MPGQSHGFVSETEPRFTVLSITQVQPSIEVRVDRSGRKSTTLDTSSVGELIGSTRIVCVLIDLKEQNVPVHMHLSDGND